MSKHLVTALLALLLVPAGASAAEPILPLGQVAPGLRCTASSVVRGTEPATFDAEVLDVIDAGTPRARILVRVSGAAIEESGIGPGFSGSPVRCPGPDGGLRIAGAISEGIGAYGGKVALATPIEQILADPVEPPSPAGRRPSVPGARALAAPLSVKGVSGPLAATLRRAAARAGRPVLVAPGGPRAADGGAGE
ncbi:MAG: hypothetical protein M3P39_01685, partial [Actinomycetota bacterium]|nr:hypothetical protein [Actinomycetota bacterium]